MSSLILIIMQIFLLIVSFIFYKLPSSGINYVYGYRSKRSMSSQEAWDYSQKLSAKYLLIITSLFLAVGIVLFVINKLFGIHVNGIEYIVLAEVIAIIGSGVAVENRLRKKFGV